MPDNAAETTGKGSLAFLKHKLGPLPVGIWLIAAGGIWWYFQQQNAKKSTAAQGANQQTDPAGNVGTIDPATGYVSGSPEDQASLASQNSGTGGGGGSAGQQATSGAQTYADNNAWGVAAVNYLVGLNIDAATANQAIQLYLSSQPLTTMQQGDVNLAIQALGPPPTLPGPVNVNPPPVTTPPGSGGGGGTQPKVTVPKVTGMTNTAASAALRAVGLVPGSEWQVTGIVNSQTPGPGTKVPKGSTVNLGVAKGTTPPPGHKGPTASVPTGLVITERHSTSLAVKWNRSKNATGYHVLCTDAGTKAVKGEGTIPAAQTTHTFTGLTPSHSYVVDVWAEPEAGAPGTGPHAHVSAVLPRTG